MYLAHLQLQKPCSIIIYTTWLTFDYNTLDPFAVNLKVIPRTSAAHGTSSFVLGRFQNIHTKFSSFLPIITVFPYTEKAIVDEV